MQSEEHKDEMRSLFLCLVMLVTLSLWTIWYIRDRDTEMTKNLREMKELITSSRDNELWREVEITKLKVEALISMILKQYASVDFLSEGIGELSASLNVMSDSIARIKGIH